MKNEDAFIIRAATPDDFLDIMRFDRLLFPGYEAVFNEEGLNRLWKANPQALKIATANGELVGFYSIVPLLPDSWQTIVDRNKGSINDLIDCVAPPDRETDIHLLEVVGIHPQCSPRQRIIFNRAFLKACHAVNGRLIVVAASDIGTRLIHKYKGKPIKERSEVYCLETALHPSRENVPKYNVPGWNP